MKKRSFAGFCRIFSAFLLTAGIPAVSQSVDFSSVPGTVIDYQPLDYSEDWPWDFHTPPREFISDPEIVVLPNGNYIASHALAGWDSGSDTSGKTTIFRSTNKGTNWTSLGTYNGILRGSLFSLNSALYLFGANDDSDGIPAVIMQSTNNGTSWISATFSFGGPGTPNNPVVLSNRLWNSGGLSSFSTPTNSNLLNETSWLSKGGFPGDRTGWFCGNTTISEGQIVASPDMGVFILPKVSQYAYTAVSRVNLTTGTVMFDPTNNFAALPGGEKKFGAAYDPVSGKFYILSNPVLPADANSGVALDMIRNTAAVLTSKDLFNWKVEKIFLYSSLVNTEGFGYLNFDFDDTNMVVIARTAFQLPGETFPDRGHDSNLLTFHRLNDFRNLSPDQYLMISGNQVLRYERTGYQNAPLGSFTLGSSFAGVALTSPNGMGKTAGGDIYIRESGGRVLHFDALGNFIETNSSAPVSFQATAMTVNQPSGGECSWTRSSSGNWADLLNWYYWGRADTTEEIAVFGSAAAAATTITIPPATQTWNFNTDGNQEGWVVGSASNTVVSGGFLQGTANTTSTPVLITRSDRFFYGSTVPEVRIRMRSDANCTVYFWWATAQADAFAAARRMNQSYTNNGEFQDFVFSMVGNPDWDGQAITQLRFGPYVHTNGAGRTFAVDSITVPRESYRMKGLRFRSANPYTLSGGGQLRIEADSGAGLVEVLQGKHTNNVELVLGSDTDMVLTSNTSLHLKPGINLNGKTLHVSGAGKLLMQGALIMNGGKITVNGISPLTFTNDLTGAALNGTLQFLPEGTFAPTDGISFNLLDNESLLGTHRFTTVSLPTLSAGLKWNTNTLYSAGNVSVEAIQHSLTVSTPYGKANPPGGTNWFNYGSTNSAAITNSPVINGTTTQFICRGWTGTGSVPAGGTSTNTGSFTLTTNSTLIWLWTTNYWLDTAVTTGGRVNVSDGWKTNGAGIPITASPDAYYHFMGWSGDMITNNTQITVTMTGARSVTANFAQNITTNTSTPEWWLAQYGLTNFSADAAADIDGDGLLTWQEYVAGTDPTNSVSSFRITGGDVNAQGAVVRWSSVSNHSYSLSRTTNLLEPFSALAGASNLPATPPENVYTNPSSGSSKAFYRISVQP